MPLDLHGINRPHRRSRVHCHSCRIPFAYGTEPAPEDGYRWCRDCRRLAETYGATLTPGLYA